MRRAEVLTIYDQLVTQRPSNSDLDSRIPKIENILNRNSRPNSWSINGAGRGDEGKGSTAYRIQLAASNNGKIKTVGARDVGGNNTGHEVKEGSPNHLVPAGAFIENSEALILRRVLLHPNDFQTEVLRHENLIGGRLPGNIAIDDTTILGLDTHRALEAAIKSRSSAGNGSTNMGIGPGYASLSLKEAIRVRDLLADNWEERISAHYDLLHRLTRGFEGFEDLSDIRVPTLSLYGEKGAKRAVGTKAEFIDRLASNRQFLIDRKYVVQDMLDRLTELWKDPTIPWVREGTQATGLESDFGAWPDTTAGLVSSRDVHRASYGIITYEDIAFPLGVIKPYMSSVGSARYPSIHDQEYEEWIRNEFNERGKTSGRPRDILPLAVPMLRFLRRADGYSGLVMTHMDASTTDKPFAVITNYRDKNTGEEKDYFPDQEDLDKLEAEGVRFKGWDGQKFRNISSLEQAPHHAKTFLAFISETVAPVVMTSHGMGDNDFISIPGLIPGR